MDTAVISEPARTRRPEADDFRYPDGHGVDLAALRAYRLGRLRAALVARDCAGGLFFDPVNVRYATDSTNMQVWVMHNAARYLFVATDGPVVLFDYHNCDFLSRGLGTVDELRAPSPICPYEAGPKLAERTAGFAPEIEALVREHGGANRRLAVDTVNHLVTSALAASGLALLDGHDVAEQARSIKSADEIAAMRVSIGVCEAAMAAMQRETRPGMTENEIWSILHRENIARGGEWIETRLLTSGARTNPWFQECSHRRVEPGDLITYDTDLIGPFGYCADISRAFVCGGARPIAAQRSIYRIAHEQIRTNIEILKPGMSFREFSNTGFDLPAPYRKGRYASISHGIGLADEYPKVLYPEDWDAAGYDGIYVPGMTVCIESFVGHEDGGEGVKLEDMVLVTETGTEILSTYPYEQDLLS